MQGIYLDMRRPKSKKEIREAVAAEQARPVSIVSIEATSLHGNEYEYEGSLDDAPDGAYHFVGPCPFTDRRFYGTITKRAGKVVVK